jgi:hypothetical protein
LESSVGELRISNETVALVSRLASLGLLAIAAILIISAVLSTVLTRYTIYETRVEIWQPIRKHSVVHMYEIDSVRYLQPLLYLILATAVIEISTEQMQPFKSLTSGGVSHLERRRILRIKGVGSGKRMFDLFEQIRDLYVNWRIDVKSFSA